MFCILHFRLKNFPCVNLTPVVCLQRGVFWRGDRICQEQEGKAVCHERCDICTSLELCSRIMFCCSLISSFAVGFDCLLMLNHQSALLEPSHDFLWFTDHHLAVHSSLGFVTSERRKLSDRSTSYWSFQTVTTILISLWVKICS